MSRRASKRWVVALDGGGSKIAVAAQLCSDQAPAPDSLDAARVWTYAHCGSAHPSAWNTARHHLAEALHAVCRALGLSESGYPVGHVLLALAGAGREADRSRVLDWARTLELPLNGASIECVSDIEPLIDYRRGERSQQSGAADNTRDSQPAADELHAVQAFASSVAVILGTGSIVATRDRSGELVRAGGWGPHLGDECSGGALGIAALRSVVGWLDAGGQPADAPPLVVAVLLALPNRREWMSGIGEKAPARAGQLAANLAIDRPRLARLLIETAAERSSAAALAHVVLEQAYDQRDADALQLLEPHLERLSWQIEQVVRRAQLDAAALELVFSGGLATHCAALRQAIVSACMARKLVLQNTVVAEPLLAALRLAANSHLNGSAGAR